MHAIGDVPGHYKITVTNYLEDGTRGAAMQATTGVLGIFRKRDNGQMMTFTVRQTGAREPVIYANEFCAAQRNLKFIVLTFEAEIQLSSGYAILTRWGITYPTRHGTETRASITSAVPTRPALRFTSNFRRSSKTGSSSRTPPRTSAPLTGSTFASATPSFFPLAVPIPTATNCGIP